MSDPRAPDPCEAIRQQRDDALAHLRQAATELRIAGVIFDSVQAVMVTDARRVILRVNEAFTQLTGYSADEVIGKTPWLLRSGHHDKAFYAAMLESIGETGTWQGEIWDRHKSGAVFPKWMTVTVVPDDDERATHFIATYVDISERKRAEEKIHQLAFYDVLTGLPNRALLMERLQHAIDGSIGKHLHGAVVLIDLDDFKRINDSLGHPQGDVLLRQVADRLRACVAETDTVARLGGDEYVLVLAGLCESAEQAASGAEHVAERVRQALAESFEIGGLAWRATASMGVALFAAGQPDADALIKQAELAMYRAKDDGRAGLHFFDAALEEAINRRVYLEREIDKALAEGQFALHYQPQVDKDGQVVGAEGLIRWHHPERGLISPAEFIPLAEETGQILPMGAWVLETACDLLAVWAGQPALAQITLAVNVSARQFRQADFVDQLARSITRTGADPQRLKLELTESMLVDDVDAVIEKMHAIKALGVRLSLDDFGTGYSSLSYLRRMPLDQLKIDQSFVRNMPDDANAVAIARAVAALAHSLGLSVVAEGVETAAQRETLTMMDCTLCQGYYFSRPLPLDEFTVYLARR